MKCWKNMIGILIKIVLLVFDSLFNIDLLVYTKILITQSYFYFHSSFKAYKKTYSIVDLTTSKAFNPPRFPENIYLPLHPLIEPSPRNDVTFQFSFHLAIMTGWWRLVLYLYFITVHNYVRFPRIFALVLFTMLHNGFAFLHWRSRSI